VRSILLFKKLLGLVEMTSGLVNVTFSLPKWQAVKMIFFAPRHMQGNKKKKWIAELCTLLLPHTK